MGSDTGARVFLSYASQDLPEVERLDLELRRRGVQLWRDKESLDAGRLVDAELERAADEAAGFAFYLTSSAAGSEWVRERELEHARRNAARRSGFGIVPIFREGRRAVTDEMVTRGIKAGGPGAPSPYDLSHFAGYSCDQDSIARGRLDEELRRAAVAVLRSLLWSLARQRPRDAALSIGLATRGGPSLRRDELDLVVDWTADYDSSPPDSATCSEQLEPALASLWTEVRRHLPSLRLRVVPQCHNTMALAVGFRLRRNTGAILEVGNPYNDEIWQGPCQPLEPLAPAWRIEEAASDAGGSGTIMVISISQPVDKMRREVAAAARRLGLTPAIQVTAEPAAGAGKTVLGDLPPEQPHRMAVAIADKLLELRASSNGGISHLFYAGPPGLAVLIGQQLSNTGPVQTYEWLDSQGTYTPAFTLTSS